MNNSNANEKKTMETLSSRTTVSIDVGAGNIRNKAIKYNVESHHSADVNSLL